ncbi:MAG: hypothetical protein NXY57DRAFT_984153, partial [Lentinula lateritia]
MSIGSYLDDETGRRRKQLFNHEERTTQYLDTPVASYPPSDRSEDAEDSAIPNVQMSGLHLGIEMSTGTRTSPTGSVYLDEDDVEEEFDCQRAETRSRKYTSQSSATHGRPGSSRAAVSRSGKRPVTSDEEDESALDQSVDALPTTVVSPTKPSGKKRKVNRYPCPVSLCKETFTRRNDVRRHIKNAAVHRDSPEALALLGEVVGAGTRCKYCNADLSRSDARMRHERASACGKRTTQKMKDQMLLKT